MASLALPRAALPAHMGRRHPESDSPEPIATAAGPYDVTSLARQPPGGAAAEVRVRGRRREGGGGAGLLEGFPPQWVFRSGRGGRRCRRSPS